MASLACPACAFGLWLLRLLSKSRSVRGERLSLGLALLLLLLPLILSLVLLLTLSSHQQDSLSTIGLDSLDGLESVASPTSTSCEPFLRTILYQSSFATTNFDNLHHNFSIAPTSSFSQPASLVALPEFGNCSRLCSSNIRAAFVDSAFLVSSLSTRRRPPLRPRNDTETTQNSSNRYLASPLS